MKKTKQKIKALLYSGVCLLLINGLGKANAQVSPLNFSDYTYSFEDTTHWHTLVIDTTSNPNNTWQIGKPQKTVFDSAFSAPNAIVTDTINPYPVNDTSSFVLIHTVQESVVSGVPLFVKFYYKIHSDTINDYGIFELSPDNGKTWIDMLNDSTYKNYIQVSLLKPTGSEIVTFDRFSGNSNGWKSILFQISPALSFIYNLYHINDTVLFRFTFISDSVQNFKDGWLIDDIRLIDIYGAIKETPVNSIPYTAYLNPTNSKIYIQFKESPIHEADRVQIFNNIGGLIKSVAIKKHQKNITINLGSIPPGMYFLRVLSKNTALGNNKFIKY